jgi:hypothetical protein
MNFASTDINDAVIAKLKTYKMLQGLAILDDDRGDIETHLATSISSCGINAIIGANLIEPAERDNLWLDKNSILISVAECSYLNRQRERPVDGNGATVTVANDAARLALTAIVAGQQVRQTTASTYFGIDAAWDYFLVPQMTDAGVVTAPVPATAAHWAPVFTLRQMCELIKRGLQGEFCTPCTTLLWLKTEFFKLPKNPKIVGEDLIGEMIFEAQVNPNALSANNPNVLKPI